MIRRLVWQVTYARLCMRSAYDFTWLSAWREASASWEMNDEGRGDDPILTPNEAIAEDRYEWSNR